jgi:hypothetical protein
MEERKEGSSDLIITSITPNKLPLSIKVSMIKIPFITITCGESQDTFAMLVTIQPRANVLIA